MASIDAKRNIKHECAAYAYACITDVADEIPNQKEYRSEVMSTGTRIHDSGLMQTLAFYCSKMKAEKPHFERLSLHVMKWILRDEKVNDRNVNTSKWDDGKGGVLTLFSFLLDQSDEKMMWFTREAMEVAQWLKRFADARLEK